MPISVCTAFDVFHVYAVYIFQIIGRSIWGFQWLILKLLVPMWLCPCMNVKFIFLLNKSDLHVSLITYFNLNTDNTHFYQ